MGLRYLPLLLAAVLAALLLSHLVLIELRTEEGEVRRALVLCSSPVTIEFNHSLTLSPVKLKFRACGELRAEGIETDAGTMEYYSGGFWDVNGSARSFRAEKISFCSAGGFLVKVGGREEKISGTCVEISSARGFKVLLGLLPVP
ncbi:MAG: hypothetical protein ABDH61_04755 [Acidilobaceae archaeon]